MRQINWEINQIIVAFLENLTFTIYLMKICTVEKKKLS
jgi:hypothetical protein